MIVAFAALACRYIKFECNRVVHCRSTDFDDWLVETFAQVSSSTMLIVLVEMRETTVSPLASSYLHVVGDETRWTDKLDLLSGAGASWNGACSSAPTEMAWSTTRRPGGPSHCWRGIWKKIVRC
jgi:hypothetical protein